ncbi:Hypothetical predicted protein [Cloeon dipterum]|uniref:C-type lectin domain-containing protein n=1 Tax=Cloeon dipterum TaxID=197152 RepID=A0A8S1DIS3_9INSE|nr:Hypothetical predicted protein [Cloeon dipterum]
MSASFAFFALGIMLVLPGFQSAIFVEASSTVMRNNTPECRQKLRESGFFAPVEAGGIYVLSTDSYNWTEARNFCKDLCLDLAVIGYPMEVQVLNNETERKFHGSVDLWTAGTNTFRESGEFLWPSDTTITNDLWLEGQPSTVNAGESSCVNLRKRGLGNQPCSDTRKALCKMQTTDFKY